MSFVFIKIFLRMLKLSWGQFMLAMQSWLWRVRMLSKFLPFVPLLLKPMKVVAEVQPQKPQLPLSVPIYPSLLVKVWFIRYFHQSRIPNLQFFFKQIFIMIFFSTGKRQKAPSFEPIKSLFTFSTAQTEKITWKKIRETNWWNKLVKLSDEFVTRTKQIWSTWISIS